VKIRIKKKYIKVVIPNSNKEIKISGNENRRTVKGFSEKDCQVKG
jgi:hypothetical protein